MAAGAASAGGVPPQLDAIVAYVLGMSLMVVDGTVFGYYATRNAAVNPFEGQQAFWRYLQAVGGTAAIFGLSGFVTLRIDSTLVVASGDLALFLFIASISFAMREIYYNSAVAPAPEERRVSLATVRRIELALFVVVALEWFGVVFIDRAAVTTGIKALASVVLTGYGVVFSERLESLTAGTGLDTLRLHLLPVLAMAGLLGVVDVATLVGAPAAAVASVEVTLVALVGGLLLPATIRLQQNVGGIEG